MIVSGSGDFARDLFLRLVAVAGHALDPAPERGDRTLALFVRRQCGDDGEPAAALFRADTGRLGCGRGPCGGGAAGTTTGGARGFLFVRFLGGTCGGDARLQRGRRRRFREALLGDFVGLALDFFVVLAALVFLALAQFGRRAFGALRLVAAVSDARFFFRNLAFFRLAQARVGERMGAGAALFLGERAQHHAGRLGRRVATWYGALAGFGGHDGALGRRGALDRRDRLGLAVARTAGAAFHLLDDDRLAATMAEALAHDALLDAAALQGQRLRRTYAQLLAAILGRLSHTRHILGRLKFGAACPACWC